MANVDTSGTIYAKSIQLLRFGDDSDIRARNYMSGGNLHQTWSRNWKNRVSEKYVENKVYAKKSLKGEHY